MKKSTFLGLMGLSFCSMLSLWNCGGGGEAKVDTAFRVDCSRAGGAVVITVNQRADCTFNDSHDSDSHASDDHSIDVLPTPTPKPKT